MKPTGAMSLRGPGAARVLRALGAGRLRGASLGDESPDAGRGADAGGTGGHVGVHGVGVCFFDWWWFASHGLLHMGVVLNTMGLH